MHSQVDVSYLADTVLLLRYFEAGGMLRQSLAVLKKRVGEHERSLRELTFQPGRILVGRPLSAFRGVLTGVPEFIGEKGHLTVGPEQDLG